VQEIQLKRKTVL